MRCSRRRPRALPVVLAALVVAAVAGGCTATTSDFTECASADQCRTEFGVGAVCRSDGFCEYAPANPRCARTFPETLMASPVDHRRYIVIGDLMDRSLATHRARENAVELALSQANSQGGFQGRLFAAVFCTIEENSAFDEATRRQAVIASARYLVDTIGVRAIVGPAASGDVQAVFAELAGDDVLLISPSATSPALTDLEQGPFTDETPGLLWRTAPPDSWQGRAIADDMTRPGAERTGPVTQVAVIHETGAYGDGLTDVFEEAYTGSVVRLPYDDPAVLGEAVAVAGSSGVEEVVFASSQIADVIAFLNAATLPSYDDKSIFLTDGAANSDVLTLADPLRFAQVRGSRPAPLDAIDDVVYASFLASYQASYNEDAAQYSFSAHAYDAAWLIVYGMVWAIANESGLGGHTIAKGLRRLSDPAAPVIDVKPSSFGDIAARLQAGASVDIAGASGPLDYDPATEETKYDIEIWRIENSLIVGIDTWSPP